MTQPDCRSMARVECTSLRYRWHTSDYTSWQCDNGIGTATCYRCQTRGDAPQDRPGACRLVRRLDQWSDLCGLRIDEFRSDLPSRFFPYPTNASHDLVTFWSTKRLPVTLDYADTQLAQCAHAVALYVEGQAERKIAHATRIPSGSVQRLAVEVAWILDGLHKLACVPELGCPQTVSNQIALLARRVRWARQSRHWMSYASPSGIACPGLADSGRWPLSHRAS